MLKYTPMANIGRYSMYYDRTLSSEFSKLIEPNGSLSWLFTFVKGHDDLDFLIGKNNKKDQKEWISIYRGLTRILRIRPTSNAQTIIIDAHDKYKNMLSNLYGKDKDVNVNFQDDLSTLITQIKENPEFDKYYNNKKEGYYQNALSRKYGICGGPDTDFVIIDKEAEVGYEDQKEKDKLFSLIQKPYIDLKRNISIEDAVKYGEHLEEKPSGKSLDFLALDKEGNILLIEFKHGSNTSGIYLSPLQIGLYYDIFKSLPNGYLDEAVNNMLNQKQKIGLINPKWKAPKKIKDIIPVLVISEYNYRSTAKSKFDEILQITRTRQGEGFLSNLRTYNFLGNGLSELK